MNKYLKFLLLLPVTLSLMACNSNPPKRDPEYAPVSPAAIPQAPTGNGAIYQVGYDTRWFEDIRARRVGDILTVTLDESTDAEMNNSTDITQSNETSITNPTLFGQPASFSSSLLGNSVYNLGFDLQSDSTFEGEGETEQDHKLTGSVTVMVTEVLPNGLLRIRGEKRLGLNSGNEYIKLSGLVRASDIDTNNTVSSTKVADATLIYKGDGQIANTNIMGWLAKFFISALVPF